MGAISFAQAYGQFVHPITLPSQQDLQPGSVGIYAFIGAEFADWHRVMAFASIYVLPILALFLLLHVAKELVTRRSVASATSP